MCAPPYNKHIMSLDASPLNKMKTEEVCHCICCPKFQEWRETSRDTFTMAKGKYYVGDLAHVLPEELWDEVNEAGKFTLSNGREVVCFLHEGSQPEKGNETNFYIESGMIGITLIAGLKKKWVCPNNVLGGWGPHYDELKALANESLAKNTRRRITMTDYMKIAGTQVVYDAEFECFQTTMSHYNHDDHSTTTYFGDKVSLSTVHGAYDTDDGSGSEQ